MKIEGFMELIKISLFCQAHPEASKQERNMLCKLIDCTKLSPEASLHAAQNERLPIRTVVQVLFSEQNKLNKRILDYSGYCSGMLSPNIAQDAPANCPSKHEINLQKREMKRLKEDVLRLQSHCMTLEGHIEKLMEKNKRFFIWKKIGIPTFRGKKIEEVEKEGEFGIVKDKTPKKWRKSLS